MDSIELLLNQSNLFNNVDISNHNFISYFIPFIYKCKQSKYISRFSSEYSSLISKLKLENLFGLHNNNNTNDKHNNDHDNDHHNHNIYTFITLCLYPDKGL